MQQQDALLWGQVVFLCGLAAGGIISWGLTSLISVIPALIIGAATGIAVWFVASPVVGRLFPPKDLLERQRLVQAFVATQERHQRAREAEAEGARQSRQFRRIVEDDLSG